jgi:hypothetical protein
VIDLEKFFDMAAGTVAGRDHKALLKNNQDAYVFEARKDALVGVVADGCGSGAWSEVGAQLGARLVVQAVHRWYGSCPELFTEENAKDGFAKVRRMVLHQLGGLLVDLGGSYSETVGEGFLFTVVGFLITRDRTFIFAAGDGLIIMNGERLALESGERNAPEYMSYGLLENSQTAGELRVLWMPNTEKVESLLIATDGAFSLEKAAEHKMPGKTEKVGPISQFWSEDRYFKNPFTLGRQLNLLNREVSHIDYEKKRNHVEVGPLNDDTTLMVLRRKA